MPDPIAVGSVALSVTPPLGTAPDSATRPPVSMITFRYPAPEGVRFGPDAFTRSIGRRCQVGSGEGILREATVIEEGAFALVTVETPEAGNLLTEALIASIRRD
jgi:hypothetical protein